MQPFEDPRFATPQDGDLPPADPNRPPTKEGRGCLFWGCLISGILFLVLVIGIPVAAYFAARHYVLKITTDTAELTNEELPEQQLAELSNRLAAFFEAVQANAPPPDLTLTAREINGLIAAEEELRGRVLIRVADGRVGGEVSLPADKLPGGKGRFFNPSVDFEISLQEGALVVRLTAAEVNGEPIPQAILDLVANPYLAAATGDPDVREFLAPFHSLVVVGDKIVLTAKRPTKENPPAGVNPEIESFDEAADPQPFGVDG